ATTTFTVTVQDTTAPAISGTPANQTLEAASASGAMATFTAPGWTDAVDGHGNAHCAPLSATIFALGTTTVTCGKADAHGNAASASFTVTVQDTTAPSITAPATVTTTVDPQQTYASGVGLGTPTTSDAVGVTSVTNDVPAHFPLGT